MLLTNDIFILIRQRTALLLLMTIGLPACKTAVEIRPFTPGTGRIICLSLCLSLGVGVGVCCYYRQDAAKRQTAGIKFTHRRKIRFFAPQGRLVAPIQVKLCRTDGQVRLAVQNFTSISPGGGNAAPKISKISTFR